MNTGFQSKYKLEAVDPLDPNYVSNCHKGNLKTSVK